MPTQLTAEDGRQSLTAHAAAKGLEIHQKYGPRLGWEELQQILADRSCTRYPCELEFDAAPLLEGEFAYPVAKGDRPEEGFRMCVHPAYRSHLDQVAYLVLYQLVMVNYGGFASAEDAEAFAASALGLEQEAYYQALCELADQAIAFPEPAGYSGLPPACGGCS